MSAQNLMHNITETAVGRLTENELGFIQQFADPELVIPENYSPDASRQAIAFLGRNLQTGREAANILGDTLITSPDKKFKVISFYTTDNGYVEHARRLEASLKKYNIDYLLQPVDSMANWESACAYKSTFIYEQWQNSDIPVVWLDADATLEAYPALFAAIEADFAIHKWRWNSLKPGDGWQFSSGTLYFGKSEATEKLLQQWQLRCQADPHTWDQEHLCSAWCDISAILPLRTVWLPRCYLQINGAPQLAAPVIMHWQASREQKQKGRKGLPQFEMTEAGIRDRQLNRLWRTADELFWIAEGTDHIIPNTGIKFSEGGYVKEMLSQSIETDFPVLEIGCGIGRIASLFEPDQYMGVDINPRAVMQARSNNPHHNIRIFDQGYCYPPSGSVLLYAVLLHISDEDAVPFLIEAVKNTRKVVIVEVMDSRWRREGNPPVYNRDPEDYIYIMQRLGLRFKKSFKHEYQRYQNQSWAVGKDTRLTSLIFEKE